ncbi:RUN domain-containing protein 1 [Pectinophora gossypiella]|uniref:RUN domain-containing protein n=1 Tax=Pectinophora gossypiella TaxID=13191 RepID=A0A1E1W4Y3_PECGO|nr:RUN domain-containing protein 1 [Pectinophora gossypiella]
MSHDLEVPNFSDDDGEIPIWQEPRREPLGAPKESLCDEETPEQVSGDRLHALEEEQEILSSSVFSLTSHLAQVEFRLRQILKAPQEEKDAMLKALEEFTSRGVPDSRAAPQGSADEPSCSECVELERKMRRQRTRQTHFVEKLKTQLKELERFAAESPETGGKQHRTLIEHLRTEIDRSLEEGCHQPLSADELRHQINCAVRQYADRQLSKDEIIGKLQTHIEDMQKFINLMKTEELKSNPTKTKAPEPKKIGKPENSFDKNFNKNKMNDDLRAETINLMRKASTLIQIFTVSQFGCSPNTNSRRYERKSSTIVTHWGNLRAKLEMSIDGVLHLVSRDRPSHALIDSYDSESEEGGVIINDAPLTTAVRRHLAVNLRDLLQHGLTGPESTSLVPIIGCFPVRRSSMSRTTHIWELILRYYELNDGDRFNSTPARKLSQSFNLDIVGGTAITNKQSLLSAIGSILASHMPYKRSYDAHFKAFVCAALNAHKLVIWLNIILKCRSLVDSYYSSTSYVVNTGFQDALQSLDRLTPHNFDLPVDLAVKQFQNIKDVFM